MTLAPLLDAPAVVQLHVACVVPAALLGVVVFIAQKGTRLHRLLGRFWLVLMALAALSSFFINEMRVVGPFSPIHLLSVWVLVSCYFVIANARKGRIEAHRRAVSGLYLGGIVGAGAFTFAPGRRMYAVLFGGRDLAAIFEPAILLPTVAVLIVLVLLAVIAWRKGFGPRRESARRNTSRTVGV